MTAGIITTWYVYPVGASPDSRRARSALCSRPAGAGALPSRPTGWNCSGTAKTAGHRGAVEHVDDVAAGLGISFSRRRGRRRVGVWRGPPRPARPARGGGGFFFSGGRPPRWGGGRPGGGGRGARGG